MIICKILFLYFFCCCCFVVVVFSLLFFSLGFTAHQDYFTHFEPSQSLGWAKTGDPREKPPDHPQAEHVARARLEPTAVR